MLEFTILGQPVAKGRPKFSMRSNYPVAYTPSKTRLAESDIRAQVVSQLPPGFIPLAGPLIIRIDYFLQKPKSAPKSRAYPTTKPDIENLVKATLDAMNTVVFVDDRQVVNISATKTYGIPKTKITIIDLSQPHPPQPQQAHSAQPEQ